jgi:hypothetical protein
MLTAISSILVILCHSMSVFIVGLLETGKCAIDLEDIYTHVHVRAQRKTSVNNAMRCLGRGVLHCLHLRVLRKQIKKMKTYPTGDAKESTNSASMAALDAGTRLINTTPSLRTWQFPALRRGAELRRDAEPLVPCVGDSATLLGIRSD